MTAAQRRTGRAVARALASVDALWARDSFGAPLVGPLRQLLIDALADELELDREALEVLVDVARMT